MRLGEDYGIRLNQKHQNLKDAALERLSQSYSSHGFVIDADEACALFNRVRMAEPLEQRLVQELGAKARHPGAGVDVVIENHTDTLEAYSDDTTEENNGEEVYSDGHDTSALGANGGEGAFPQLDGGDSSAPVAG